MRNYTKKLLSTIIDQYSFRQLALFNHKPLQKDIFKKVCDEIYGEENFVSQFIWQKKSGGGQAKYFYEGHESVLIYAKNKRNLKGIFSEEEIEKGTVEKDVFRKVHGNYNSNSKLKELLRKYPGKLKEHRNIFYEEIDILINILLLL